MRMKNFSNKSTLLLFLISAIESKFGLLYFTVEDYSRLRGDLNLSNLRNGVKAALLNKRVIRMCLAFDFIGTLKLFLRKFSIHADTMI